MVLWEHKRYVGEDGGSGEHEDEARRDAGEGGGGEGKREKIGQTMDIRTQ